MMTIEDYALDVGKTIDEIKALCDKIGINYEDEKTPLDETDIILLDNELQDDEEVAEDNEELDEKILDEEVSDKAEILAMNTKFDLENETKFEKVKTKQVKKTENKKDFLKERKKIYKHREKLQSNENVQNKNVILYNEGMTVTDLATALEVGAVEIVKKLMGLGVMASINQSIDYDSAEVIASEYDKVLKKAETADISNFENFDTTFIFAPSNIFCNLFNSLVLSSVILCLYFITSLNSLCALFGI